MAPRGRPKKNATRMAAALDAMRQFGFHDLVVKKVLKELLKTYDENWVFIEDNSYRVLLDLILEQQEQNHEDNASSSKKTDEIEVNNTPTVAAGPSSGNAEGVDAPELALPANATSLPNATAVSYGSEGEAAPMQAESEEKIWKDIRPDESHHKTNSHVARIKEEGAAAKPNGIPCVPPGFAPISYHKQQTAEPINAVRKPCYGWIDDEDDEPEFIELEPAPLPESLLRLLVETENQRKRKPTWDDVEAEDT